MGASSSGLVVALVANGPVSDHSLLAKQISKCDRVVAVDGGLAHCQKMNIVPSLIVGDQDSSEPALLEQFADIPTVKYPEHKDESDLELALREIDTSEIGSVLVYGALGGRTDHLIANLALLTRFAPQRVNLVSETEQIFLLPKRTVLQVSQQQEVSLLPLFSPVTKVLTRGLKWELHDRTLTSDFLSLSNQAVQNQVEIQYETGHLLCSISDST